MKRKTAVLLIVLAVLLIGIGLLVWWQWNNLTAIRYAMQISRSYDYDDVPKYPYNADPAYAQSDADAHHLSWQSEVRHNKDSNTPDCYVFHLYVLDDHCNQQQITSFATSGLIIS